MSVTAIVATVVLALWLLASVGTLLGFGWLRAVLAPFHRFRFFGSWAMFAAGEGRKGAYGLAYRDMTGPGGLPAWTTIHSGHHWSWHVFLLDPRRARADAVHAIGRDLHRNLQQSPTSATTHENAFAQARLREYLNHLAPVPAGTKREIRVNKHFGRGDSPESAVICQFSGQPDAEG